MASMPTLVSMFSSTCRLINEIRARLGRYLGGKYVLLKEFARWYLHSG
jgi:hypothetical protein